MAAEAGLKRKAVSQEIGANESEQRQPEPQEEGITSSAQDRMSQFRALRMRAKDSKRENRQALYAEHARLKADPKAAKALEHQKSIASEKLAKLDAAEQGDDYERKRAWDYSIAESEAWDAKVAQRKENKEAAGYTDYASEAAAQYARSTRDLRPDLNTYTQQQAELSLALGNTHGSPTIAADGSLVQNDPHALRLAELNHVGFVHQKASKEGIDKLLASLSRADAAKLKAQVKRRRAQGDEGDYINNQNKIFNEKVARHYNQYTKEMKDSFERGTAQ